MANLVRKALSEFAKSCEERSVDHGHCGVLLGFVCEGWFSTEPNAKMLAKTLNTVPTAHMARMCQFLCDAQNNSFVDTTMRLMAPTLDYQEMSGKLTTFVEAVEELLRGDPGELKSGLFPNAEVVGEDYEPPPMQAGKEDPE